MAYLDEWKCMKGSSNTSKRGLGVPQTHVQQCVLKLKCRHFSNSDAKKSQNFQAYLTVSDAQKFSSCSHFQD